MTDRAVAELAGRIGVRDACVAIGASQAGYYRRHRVARHLSGRRRSRTANGRNRAP